MIDGDDALIAGNGMPGATLIAICDFILMLSAAHFFRYAELHIRDALRADLRAMMTRAWLTSISASSWLTIPAHGAAFLPISSIDAYTLQRLDVLVAIDTTAARRQSPAPPS